MTKPFPCCCSCVHCPDYDFSTDTWKGKFCGLALGSPYGFLGSSTGNPIHTDLNNLLAFDYLFNQVTTISTNVLEYTNETADYNPTHPTIGIWPAGYWDYRIGGVLPNYTLGSIHIAVWVRDFCSKSHVQRIRITADITNSNTGLTVHRSIFDRINGTIPGSPNCGNALQSGTSVYDPDGLNQNFIDTTSGRFVTRLASVGSLTCLTPIP